MDVKKTYNTTKEEILSKRFNIFIGISLGNKFFSKDNLRKYLDWSLNNTKDVVLVLIADKIQAINYNARNKLKMETAINKALREGDKIKEFINELIEELPKEIRSKIILLRWNDLENDLERKNFLNQLYTNFNQMGEFQKSISKIVKEYTSKEERKFDEESLKKMEKYLIEELPEFLRGVEFKRLLFDLYIYPKDNGFFKFVQKIQEGKINLQVYEELPKKKIAFAVIN